MAGCLSSCGEKLAAPGWLVAAAAANTLLQFFVASGVAFVILMETSSSKKKKKKGHGSKPLDRWTTSIDTLIVLGDSQLSTYGYDYEWGWIGQIEGKIFN